MRTYLDCYPCFLRQTLEAARMAGADEDRQYRVLQEVLNELGRFKLTSTPPEMAYRIHQIVRQEMGGRDPYRQAKETSTRQALALYPRLKALVAEAEAKRRPIAYASHGEIEALIARSVTELSAADVDRLRDVILNKYY